MKIYFLIALIIGLSACSKSGNSAIPTDSSNIAADTSFLGIYSSDNGAIVLDGSKIIYTATHTYEPTAKCEAWKQDRANRGLIGGTCPYTTEHYTCSWTSKYFKGLSAEMNLMLDDLQTDAEGFDCPKYKGIIIASFIKIDDKCFKFSTKDPAFSKSFCEK